MQGLIDDYVHEVHRAMFASEKNVKDRRGAPLAVDSPHANISDLKVDDAGFSKTRLGTNR